MTYRKTKHLYTILNTDSSIPITDNNKMQKHTHKEMVIIEGIYLYFPSGLDYREKVLIYLSRNLGRKVTINAISEALGLAYGYLHSTIHKLNAEGIISIEEVGNYKLVSLNLKNMLTIAELARLSVKIAQSIIPKAKSLKKIPLLIELLRKHKGIVSIVLFGSQARLQAKETSDTDLLVIVQERTSAQRELVNKIRSETRAFEIKEFIKIQEFLVDTEMVKSMLSSKEDINVGKEALKEGIVLEGFENYWRLIGDILG